MGEWSISSRKCGFLESKFSKSLLMIFWIPLESAVAFPSHFTYKLLAWVFSLSFGYVNLGFINLIYFSEESTPWLILYIVHLVSISFNPILVFFFFISCPTAWGLTATQASLSQPHKMTSHSHVGTPLPHTAWPKQLTPFTLAFFKPLKPALCTWHCRVHLPAWDGCWPPWVTFSSRALSQLISGIRKPWSLTSGSSSEWVSPEGIPLFTPVQNWSLLSSYSLRLTQPGLSH